MRGGRGQVTAFVLIGLAILIVLLLVLLLRAAILGTQAAPAVADGYDAALVEAHVDSCLDLVANDAFKKLGEQGGLLYTTQGGLHDPGYVFPGTATVASWPVKALVAPGQVGSAAVLVGFGLINDSGFAFRPPFTSDFLRIPSNPPDWSFDPAEEQPYPWPGLGLDQLSFAAIKADDTHPLHLWSDPSDDGPYGQYVLPGACDPAGANNMAFTNPNLRCPRQLFSHPYYHRTSVQASLEAFLEAGLGQCLDPDEFARRLGTSVTLAAPNVTVTYTESETLVELDLGLRFADEEGALRLGRFTRRYPVRLYKVMDYAYRLLKRVSKDPAFRLADAADYNSIAGQDGFAVTQRPLEERRTGRKDLLLVTITDPESRVDRAAWSFSFLVQDRAPILDRLDSADFVFAHWDPQTHPPVPAMTKDIYYLDPDGDIVGVDLEVLDGTDVIEATDLSLPNDGPRLLQIRTLATTPGTYHAKVRIWDNSEREDWQRVTVTIT